jgi:hypothetical protein
MPDIVADGDNLGDHIATKSFKQIKGSDVASGDAVTLGFGGNTFDITGTTTINHINNTNWVVGSVVILHFDGAVILTHNAGGLTGSEANILLSGDTNFTSSAGDALSFVLHDSTNWVEVSRNVPSSSYTAPTLGSTALTSGATISTVAGLTLTSPTLTTPALGTPASGVATNLTGTASGLTSGNVTTNANLTGGVTSSGNATTVVTNANLTGDITSVGNATTTVTNANLTGDVTSSGNATTIAVDAVDIAMLSASGTASSSTFLRGDNQWGAVSSTESIIVSASDELTSLTTGTAKTTFRIPYAFTLTAVKVSLTNTSTGGNPTIDINESGTSILSSPVAITAGQKTATASVSDTSLANLAEITVDIDVAGTNASGLKVYLIGSQT